MGTGSWRARLTHLPSLIRLRAFPGGSSQNGRRAAAMLYETPVSAIENSPQTSARLPEPQLDEERARHFEQPPSRGPQAPDASGNLICMAAPLRLRREQRVRQSRDFQRTKNRGQRLAVGCLALNWMEISDAIPRVGIITSRKIGSASERTRARRLLREAFRLHQHEIARPADLVLVARLSIAGKSFADVERDYLTALRRARLFKEL